MTHDSHLIIIGLILFVLILLQIIIFFRNLIQMHKFRRIFGEPGVSVSYSPQFNDRKQVVGVDADYDNEYFDRIKQSIGEYMEANAGGTIDFHLIKDAVDRNCDSVEEDCNAQVPLPLYIGLAGTMAGIIVGIGYLWWTGQLDTLMEIAKEPDKVSPEGIKTLLSGVALAMIASIVGLALTTISTWRFKGIKLQVEIGKNSFLTWMQSNLLPEVATDEVDALKKLGRTLTKFNLEFSRNSDAFGLTMERILGVNSTQNTLLQNVEKMNGEIEAMSQRNLQVASRLSNVMSVLDDFAEYVQSINGYTTSLQNFAEMFNSEADRLHILESMREFFVYHSQQLQEREDALKKGMGKLDNALLDGTKTFKERVSSYNEELKKIMAEQSDQFNSILKYQKRIFEKELKSIQSEISVLPQTAAAINGIPEKINILLEEHKKDNKKLVDQLSQSLSAMKKTLEAIGKQGVVVSQEDGEQVAPPNSTSSKWTDWLIVILVFIVALSCVFNTCVGFKTYQNAKEAREVNSVMLEPEGL